VTVILNGVVLQKSPGHTRRDELAHNRQIHATRPGWSARPAISQQCCFFPQPLGAAGAGGQ